MTAWDAATATLSASNFNRLTWTDVPGTALYKVYRKVAPTSPATVGVIYAGTALTVDDTGLVGQAEQLDDVEHRGSLGDLDGARVPTALAIGLVLRYRRPVRRLGSSRSTKTKTPAGVRRVLLFWWS